jgi:hypothetical protein
MSNNRKQHSSEKVSVAHRRFSLSLWYYNEIWIGAQFDLSSYFPLSLN